MLARFGLFSVLFFTLGMSDFTWAESLSRTVEKTQHFLSFADLHFDPFLACTQKPCPLIQSLQKAPIPEWERLFTREDKSPIAHGKDSNFALLKSALKAAEKEAKTEKIQFVLVLGDFLAHDYDRKYRQYTGDKIKTGYAAFVKKTMEFLSVEFNQAFPQTDIYWVMGNNDSYQEDYAVETSGSFFKDLGKMEASLIKNKNNKKSLLQTFSKDGYYAFTAPNQAGLRLIFLNSVLFSRKAKGSELNAAAEEQLRWLHKELLSAKEKKQKVLIAMHIPTGIDVYTTLFMPFTIIEFWKTTYSERFLNEIKQHSALMMGVFPAHIHADTFQILTSPQHQPIPFTGTPSISPIFGNNPGFKIYTYSTSDFRLVDFATFYYSLNNKNTWEKEYDFDRVYKLKESNAGIINGMLKIKPQGELAEHYKTYYAVNSNSQPITHNKWFPYYWCAIRGITLTDYKSCLTAKKES